MGQGALLSTAEVSNLSVLTLNSVLSNGTNNVFQYLFDTSDPFWFELSISLDEV